MAKRKSIACFLLALLLVFCSNNLPLDVFTSYGRSHLLHYSIACKTQGKILQPERSLNKPSLKKDHVKVRYMGGECGHNAAITPVVINAIVFSNDIAGIRYLSFISGYCHFSFNLRGPPISCTA